MLLADRDQLLTEIEKFKEVDMRTRGVQVLVLTILFFSFIGDVSALLAMAEQDVYNVGTSSWSHIDDEPVVPTDISPDEGNREEGKKEGNDDNKIIVPIETPPLYIEQNGSESIMTASDYSGEVLGVFKVTPNFNDQLPSGPRFETILDVGYGIDARFSWNLTEDLFSFSFSTNN